MTVLVTAATRESLEKYTSSSLCLSREQSSLRPTFALRGTGSFVSFLQLYLAYKLCLYVSCPLSFCTDPQWETGPGPPVYTLCIYLILKSIAATLSFPVGLVVPTWAALMPPQDHAFLPRTNTKHQLELVAIKDDWRLPFRICFLPIATH